MKIKNLEIKLEKLSEEKKAFEEKEQIMNGRIVYLEEQKMKTAQKHQVFVDTLFTEHKEQIAAMQDEVRKAGADGYKRGIDEMLSRINKSRGF